MVQPGAPTGESVFRAFFESMTLGAMLYNQDGEIIAVNATAEDLLGLSARQWRGQKFSLPGWEAIHLDGTPFLAEDLPISQALRGQPGQDIILGLVRQTQSPPQWLNICARALNVEPERYAVTLEDITPRIQAEKALVEARENFGRAFDFNPVAMAISSREDGICLQVNHAFTSLLGYTPADVAGRSAAEIGLFPNLTDRATKIRQVEQNGDGKVPLIAKSGEEYLCLVNIKPFLFEGKACLITSFQDLSGQHSAEQALRESEQHYRLLAENITDVIWIVDLDAGRFRYVSPSVRQLRGFTVEEVLAQDFNKAMTPASQEAIGRLVPARLAEFQQGVHKTYTDEVEQPCKDGRAVWTETTTRFVYNPDSRALEVYGVSRDINARRAAEQALRESETRWKYALEGAGDGLWDWDIQSNQVYFSSRWKAILGYTDAEIPNAMAEWRSRIHPDDIRQVDREMLRHLSDLTPSTSIEYRMRHKDGRYLWILGRGKVLNRDANGKPVRMLGTNSDITARHETEQRLLQSYAQSHAAAQRSEALSRTAERLNSTLDLNQIARTVCEEAAVALHMDAAHLMFFDYATQTVQLAGFYGLPEDYPGDLLPWQVNDTYPPPVRSPESAFYIRDLRRSSALPFYPLAERYNLCSTLGAPVLIEGQVAGVLSVFSVGRVRKFPPEEQSLLQTFSNLTAQSIHNAHLFNENEQARRSLQALSARILEVQEDERRTLALELHDELGQLLTTVKLSLDILSILPAEAAPAQLLRAQQLTADLLARVRRMSLELRPSMLDDLGLLPALKWLVKNFQGGTSQPLTFRHRGLKRRFSPQVEIAAYRIVQEALTNVLRHAGSTGVKLEVWSDEKNLSMRISDHGVGFNRAALQTNHATSGLSGMRERARLLGGELDIESKPSLGTKISVRLPIVNTKEGRDD